MVQNLQKRGFVSAYDTFHCYSQIWYETFLFICILNSCALRTIHTYPTLASQLSRYKQLGFQNVVTQDMNKVVMRVLSVTTSRTTVAV